MNNKSLASRNGRLSLRILITLFSLFAVMVDSVGVTKVIFAERGEKFYYFNPDSPQSNMSRLKLEMDKFLNQADFSLSFTPFARFNDFDRLTRESMPNFVLLPKWYYEENRDDLQLTPLLVPTRNGPTSYRKLLLTSKESNVTLATLSKRTLAMTFMGDDINSRLNKLIFGQYDLVVENLNIIVTPKDSDALFALALGQVEMAFVSEENLHTIGKINPRISATLKPLAESNPISLPVLCYRKGSLSKDKVEKLTKLFLESDKQNNRIMEMLQFDGWQEYSD